MDRDCCCWDTRGGHKRGENLASSRKKRRESSPRTLCRAHAGRKSPDRGLGTLDSFAYLAGTRFEFNELANNTRLIRRASRSRLVGEADDSRRPFVSALRVLEPGTAVANLRVREPNRSNGPAFRSTILQKTKYPRANNKRRRTHAHNNQQQRN